MYWEIIIDISNTTKSLKMAEIKIEKKKPIWPWIIGILIVLGIIAFLFYATAKDDVYPNEINETEYNTRDTISQSSNSNYKVPSMNNSEGNYESSFTYLVKRTENLDHPTAS